MSLPLKEHNDCNDCNKDSEVEEGNDCHWEVDKYFGVNLGIAIDSKHFIKIYRFAAGEF